MHYVQYMYVSQDVENADADETNATLYHYYPHNQHLFSLPDCASQQVFISNRNKRISRYLKNIFIFIFYPSSFYVVYKLLETKMSVHTHFKTKK